MRVPSHIDGDYGLRSHNKNHGGDLLSEKQIPNTCLTDLLTPFVCYFEGLADSDKLRIGWRAVKLQEVRKAG